MTRVVAATRSLGLGTWDLASALQGAPGGLLLACRQRRGRTCATLLWVMWVKWGPREVTAAGAYPRAAIVEECARAYNSLPVEPRTRVVGWWVTLGPCGAVPRPWQGRGRRPHGPTNVSRLAARQAGVGLALPLGRVETAMRGLYQYALCKSIRSDAARWARTSAARHGSAPAREMASAAGRAGTRNRGGRFWFAALAGESVRWATEETECTGKARGLPGLRRCSDT